MEILEAFFESRLMVLCFYINVIVGDISFIFTRGYTHNLQLLPFILISLYLLWSHLGKLALKSWINSIAEHQKLVKLFRKWELQAHGNSSFALSLSLSIFSSKHTTSLVDQHTDRAHATHLLSMLNLQIRSTCFFKFWLKSSLMMIMIFSMKHYCHLRTIDGEQLFCRCLLLFQMRYETEIARSVLISSRVIPHYILTGGQSAVEWKLIQMRKQQTFAAV